MLICICICVPSKNIAVRKDVYDLLRRDRRPNESFTRVILRMLTQHGPLDELSGAWGSPPRAAERRRWRTLRGLSGGPR
jgi:predicted CopG family antitoxin